MSQVLHYADRSTVTTYAPRWMARTSIVSLAASALLFVLKQADRAMPCHSWWCDKVSAAPLVERASTYWEHFSRQGEYRGHGLIDWAVLVTAATVFAFLIGNRLIVRERVRRSALWLAMGGFSVILVTLAFKHYVYFGRANCICWMDL